MFYDIINAMFVCSQAVHIYSKWPKEWYNIFKRTFLLSGEILLNSNRQKFTF